MRNLSVLLFLVVLLLGTSALAKKSHKKISMKKATHLAPEDSTTSAPVSEDSTTSAPVVENDDAPEEESDKPRLYLPTIIGTLAPKKQVPPVPQTDLKVSPKLVEGPLEGAFSQPVEEETTTTQAPAEEEKDCSSSDEEESVKVQATVAGEEDDTDTEYVAPQMKGETTAAPQVSSSATSARLQKMLGDIRDKHEQVRDQHEAIGSQLRGLEEQLRGMESGLDGTSEGAFADGSDGSEPGMAGGSMDGGAQQMGGMSEEDALSIAAGSMDAEAATGSMDAEASASVESLELTAEQRAEQEAMAEVVAMQQNAGTGAVDPMMGMLESSHEGAQLF